MSTTLAIDPMTRIEGHLRVNITVDYVQGRQQVVDAQLDGAMFRGLEKILVGRSPLDAPDICERICGMCTVSHGVAACRALERAAGVTIPDNARIMRNLVMAADALQSHILHFYVMSLPDFAEVPQQMAPWAPAWTADRRITGAAANTFAAHYLAALDIRRKAHEMAALFAGKLPHSPSLVPGGCTTSPRQSRIDAFRALAQVVLSFVQNEYVPDVQRLAAIYPEYYTLGSGTRNLLAYGGYDLDSAGQSKFFRPGVAQNASGVPAALDLNAITESVSASWYQGGSPGTAVQMNLLHALTLAGKDLENVLVLGVEPGVIDYGCELSPEVAAALPRLVSTARYASRWCASRPGGASISDFPPALRRLGYVDLLPA